MYVEALCMVQKNRIRCLLFLRMIPLFENNRKIFV